MEKYVLSRPLIKMTEHTITTGDGLLKELEQVRERGYAVDDEEIEPGLHCIAAPIFNHKRQPQMAISMSFPYGRMWIWIGSRPFGMSYIMLSRHRSASGYIK